MTPDRRSSEPARLPDLAGKIGSADHTKRHHDTGEAYRASRVEPPRGTTRALFDGMNVSAMSQPRVIPHVIAPPHRNLDPKARTGVGGLWTSAGSPQVRPGLRGRRLLPGVDRVDAEANARRPRLTSVGSSACPEPKVPTVLDGLGSGRRQRTGEARTGARFPNRWPALLSPIIGVARRRGVNCLRRRHPVPQTEARR